MGKLVGSLWARLRENCGNACRHILGTLCRPPRTKPTVAAACLVHIPPVNKRSETKRVLIQLATEGWEGCRVAESSSPSSLQPRPATASSGPWCYTIGSGQQVCFGIYGTENAVPFLEDTLYSVFYTKTDFDVSCLAIE